MTDYFALLSLPRRPWLDPDSLKQKFLALSADAHPDRLHNAPPDQKSAALQHYTQLNTAYQTLRDDKSRLQHLLTLERGAKPADIQDIPTGLMEILLQVRDLCRRADALLAEKTATTSPLLHVALFERAQENIAALTQLQNQLAAARQQLRDHIQHLDATWDDLPPAKSPARDAALARLEELYRLFGYFTKWTAQTHERIVQLSF